MGERMKRNSLLVWLEENTIHLQALLNLVFLIMKTFGEVWRNLDLIDSVVQIGVS